MKDAYGSIPTAEPVATVPMVEITAPVTMQEGYKFNAIYDGVVFPVIVPAGGVVKDQVIIVPFNPSAAGSSGVAGAWKDDFMDCTRFGIFHPSFIMACCCPLILLGQVMTRLNLDWLGNSAPSGEWTQTFRKMVYISVAYVILCLLLSPADPQNPPSPLYNLVNFVYAVFMIYLLMRVRKLVRDQGQIPETRCIGCEDLCCAAFCGCCTVSQLARQTANYNCYDEAHFFTPDGLPPSSRTAPDITV
jgi:Cys-rich protein (TIGR01571 family)